MTGRWAATNTLRDVSAYVLWVIPDRGGGWTERATAKTRDEAEAKRKALYRSLGDVSVRVLPNGEKPWNGCLDVADARRADSQPEETTT